MTECRCTLRHKIVGDGCAICNPPFGHRPKNEIHDFFERRHEGQGNYAWDHREPGDVADLLSAIEEAFG